MPLTPNEHDAAAGYTETLTAVAIRWYASGAAEAVPWVDWGSAGIGTPSFHGWLREVPGWEDGDVHCLLYIVPEDEYEPLRIANLDELSTFDFLATKEDVAKVRAAMAGG